jgi:hypothetical protein
MGRPVSFEFSMFNRRFDVHTSVVRLNVRCCALQTRSEQVIRQAETHLQSGAAMTGKSQAVQAHCRDAGVEAGRPSAFANVVHAFALDRHVVLAGGKGFGAGTLKVDGKIFAMISSGGRFVAKLPADRVDEFVRDGIGQRFDGGRGKPMKEWLALDHATGLWIEIAKEARRFVATD